MDHDHHDESLTPPSGTGEGKILKTNVSVALEELTQANSISCTPTPTRTVRPSSNLFQTPKSSGTPSLVRCSTMVHPSPSPNSVGTATTSRTPSSGGGALRGSRLASAASGAGSGSLAAKMMMLRGSGGKGRGLLSKSSASSSATSSPNVFTTPTSSQHTHRFRPRVNPFDSATSSLPERMQLPTMSPSVFKTVSEEHSEGTNGSSGQFWTLEQQASLFPAEISEDSPFKQETATSVLDPETENRTQEAIDLYFSVHHRISSPDVPPPQPIIRLLSTASAPGDLEVNRSSSLCGARSRSGSPLQQRESRSGSPARTSRTSLPGHTDPVCQWTQTELTLPPSLPPSLETELAKFFTFTERQDNQPKIEQTGLMPPTLPLMSLADDEQQQSNLSNTTLRRKLFEGMIEDSDDEEKPIPQSSEGDQDHSGRCVTEIVKARSHLQHESTKRHDAAENGEEEEEDEGNRLMSSPIKTDSFSPSVLTPIQNKNPAAAVNGKNPTWSSSPISRMAAAVAGGSSSRRTSMSPPTGLGSPACSPIGQSTKICGRTMMAARDEESSEFSMHSKIRSVSDKENTDGTLDVTVPLSQEI